jgi:hypothetical protein
VRDGERDDVAVVEESRQKRKAQTRVMGTRMGWAVGEREDEPGQESGEARGWSNGDGVMMSRRRRKDIPQENLPDEGQRAYPQKRAIRPETV